MELPFTTDYAKSGRSICRGCSTQIAKETLRLAIMMPSSTFDGNVPNWYHYPCFFIEQMPKSVGDISNYESLKWEDQQNIKKIINKGVSPFKKEDIKQEISAAVSKASINEYKIDYATKLSRSKCEQCSEKIVNDEIRVAKKMKKKFGYYHFSCFVKVRKDLDFLECGSDLPGFEELQGVDQEMVKKNLPAHTIPVKKKRISLEEEEPLSQEDQEVKEDTNVMHEYRDQLKSNLTKDHVALLLKHNRQIIPAGFDNMLDRACEMLTFGSLGQCPQCRRGQLTYFKNGYRCSGFANVWSKCVGVTLDPIRTPVDIPMELKLRYDFLNYYEYVPRKRKIELSKSAEGCELKALYYKNVLLTGFTADEEVALRSMVKRLGGRVVTEVRRSVLLIVTTKRTVKEKSPVIKAAKECEVYVVSRKFLDEAIAAYPENLTALITKHKLCDWGTELHNRIPKEFQKGNRPINSEKREIEEASGKRRMRVKNGVAIEPDSGLDDVAHVYQIGGVVYNAVLNKTDLKTNKNSYYKIQLLEADNEEKYWLYQSWGRTGTTSADYKVQHMPDLKTGKGAFKNLFKKKTGNTWENRYCFTKKTGLYSYVDVDYRAKKEEIEDISVHVAESKLEPAVADLMAMIFNVQALEKLMLEYELDVKEMPLGKLSRLQITEGYQLLREIMWALDTEDFCRLDHLSSAFYSHIPHNTGYGLLPALSNKEIIRKKCEMLENLMEIETAYSIIQRGAADETGNPLDSYYNQLKADIVSVKEDTDEFCMTEQYVKNTHGHTHSNYDLKILELFKVRRHEEAERYKPFSNMHNRKLLWHGSRTTNYAGILSQGLRITPPEVPVTGDMFGKGIYFADMVSKSANYCCTTPTDRYGLVLLCEVALGNMSERYAACDVKKLPKDIHSVKGVGRTKPDPNFVKMLPDGVEVPLGPGITEPDGKETLQYNEYIVYDPAQVNIKYLVKLDFKYNENV